MYYVRKLILLSFSSNTLANKLTIPDNSHANLDIMWQHTLQSVFAGPQGLHGLGQDLNELGALRPGAETFEL